MPPPCGQHLLTNLYLSSEVGGDPCMPAQMTPAGMQDIYNRSPSSGTMAGLGMGQRSQYPYGPQYDRR